MVKTRRKKKKMGEGGGGWEMRAEVEVGWKV